MERKGCVLGCVAAGVLSISAVLVVIAGGMVGSFFMVRSSAEPATHRVDVGAVLSPSASVPAPASAAPGATAPAATPVEAEAPSAGEAAPAAAATAASASAPAVATTSADPPPPAKREAAPAKKESAPQPSRAEVVRVSSSSSGGTTRATPTTLAVEPDKSLVRVAGTARVVLVGADGSRSPVPANVKPGTYRIEATFSGGAPADVGSVTTAAGATYMVKCIATSGECGAVKMGL